MKQARMIPVFFILLIYCTVLTGCSSESGRESTPDSAVQNSSPSPSSVPQAGEAKPSIRVGALKGPTGLGITQLMEQNDRKETHNTYEITTVAAPDEISGKIISGELDIACVPTNMASVLYNKTGGKVKVIQLTTLGVLYVLQSNEEEAIAEIGDLAGKTIYSTGQGATQEYVLNYLLEQSGVTDARVEFKAEHAELATLLIEGSVEYALLPQPFVTTVTAKKDSIRVVLDVTKEWDRVTGGKQLAMGCIVVRDDFLQRNHPAVDRFIEEYRESVDWVNENPEEAGTLAEMYDIITKEVAQKAIPLCNLVAVSGEEMKSAVESYLEVLEAADSQSVGGSLPDDAFYYIP